jgi:hypothetical protein
MTRALFNRLDVGGRLRLVTQANDTHGKQNVIRVGTVGSGESVKQGTGRRCAHELTWASSNETQAGGKLLQGGGSIFFDSDTVGIISHDERITYR